jgi:type II secretory pathway component GspD/PulD (secretin)
VPGAPGATSGLAASQPSTGGQIQADASTNSLIITAPEPQYRQLRAVIDKLDARRAQVFVESLIVEVNADKAAEFGIQWQGVSGQNGDANVGLLSTNFSIGGTNIVESGNKGPDRRRHPCNRVATWALRIRPMAFTCWACWRAFCRPTGMETSCQRPICSRWTTRKPKL